MKLITFVFIVMMGILLATCGKALAGEVVGGKDWQVNVVARTIVAEARGEGSNGMYAVACVIQQRVLERNLSPAGVCLERLQFSCWNKATVKDKQIKTLRACWQTEYAQCLATTIVQGLNLDRKFVGFANHYHEEKVDPRWARGEKPTIKIGQHLFYRL